jgi:Lon protease-like protein
MRHYRTAADLPRRAPVFPLRGAILLPRAQLPLNVFEPRYLQMLDDVLAGARILAIVQPSGVGEESPAEKTADLRAVGCIGRITAFQEHEDGRLAITLTGIARCRLAEEIETTTFYRLFNVGYESFADDLTPGAGEAEIGRERLIEGLRRYLAARKLEANWSEINKMSNEALVNSLSLMSPYGAEEKQALLEAPNLKNRAEVLLALAEMELAAGSGGSRSLQ